MSKELWQGIRAILSHVDNHKEYFHKNKIKLKHFPVYHLQSNEQAERMLGVVENSLRK